ncbi:transcriptional regulator [Thermomonospora umbrina]|uniref:transcriptional regulator n=1 Tax=Thermomonospora umbrina TaxID=111806 RepID=UPI001FE3E6C4|nr:transcriptional regulator [Thermomonospora umbrina]
MQVQANPAYAAGQMAKAFVTAGVHEDEATRRRAEKRLRQWEKVVAGMADGGLTIGSRTPVQGLPAWVTPEVVRGGFATGDAAAGGPLEEYELRAARRAEIDPDRRELFRYHLSDVGLADLYALLDSGCYEILVPEEAALLVVAWLVRAGDRAFALELLATIGPFTDRLRMLPRPAAAPPGDASLAYRETVGQVAARIGVRSPKPAIEAMNEALAVWNPFADELLAHWLETVEDGRVGVVEPDDWRRRGTELLARHRRLAAEHPLCGKHRDPKGNPAILRTALEDTLKGRRRSGLLQHAVDAMVAKRGLPGSPEHAELRRVQAEVAARPTHHALAQIMLARLSGLPQDTGTPSIEPLIKPITEDEARRTGAVPGAPLPEPLRAIVSNALQAPIGTLVERGVVPSAEVLAELVPQLVASTTALSYQDEALRTLMASAYRAFRNRRSLLLLNLESQVRFEELPWVQAVSAYRRRGGASADDARTALTRLGELTIQGFPGTIMPNPLIREMAVLVRQAGMDVPLVEELAADIFMGTFSDKFAKAARLAADVLEGSLYERYYGVDFAAVRALDDGRANLRRFRPAVSSEGFDALCLRRAALPPDGGWVVRNGMVIEQAQILTTHNLAALVHPIGVDPSPGWDDLARRAFTATRSLVAKVHNNPSPRSTIKDAAYAWRQTLFFLSLCGLKEQIGVTAWIQDELDRQPDHVVDRLDPVVTGLRHVLVGGSLDDGSAPTARRFLGWQANGHWMRETPSR